MGYEQMRAMGIAQGIKMRTNQFGLSESEVIGDFVDRKVNEDEIKYLLQRPQIKDFAKVEWKDHTGLYTDRFFKEVPSIDGLGEKIRDIIDTCKRHNVEISGHLGGMFEGTEFFINRYNPRQITFLSSDFSCTIDEDISFSELSMFDSGYLFFPVKLIKGDRENSKYISSCNLERRIEVVDLEEISEYLRVESRDSYVSDEEILNLIISNNPGFKIDEQGVISRKIVDENENKKSLSALIKPQDKEPIETYASCVEVARKKIEIAKVLYSQICKEYEKYEEKPSVIRLSGIPRKEINKLIN